MIRIISITSTNMTCHIYTLHCLFFLLQASLLFVKTGKDGGAERHEKSVMPHLEVLRLQTKSDVFEPNSF